jgi:hypothetical protein
MARGQLSKDVKRFSHRPPPSGQLGQLAHSGKILGENYMFWTFGPPYGPEGVRLLVQRPPPRTTLDARASKPGIEIFFRAPNGCPGVQTLDTR